MPNPNERLRRAKVRCEELHRRVGFKADSDGSYRHVSAENLVAFADQECAGLEAELAEVNAYRAEPLKAVRKLLGDHESDDEAIMGSVCATIVTHHELAVRKKKAEAQLAQVTQERDALKQARDELAGLRTLAWAGWSRAEQIWDQWSMYRTAWVRELGPPYRNKTHDIDALVLTTRMRIGERDEARAALAQRDAALRVAGEGLIKAHYGEAHDYLDDECCYIGKVLATIRRVLGEHDAK